MVDWVRHGLLFQRSSYVCIRLEGLGSKKKLFHEFYDLFTDGCRVGMDW